MSKFGLGTLLAFILIATVNPLAAQAGTYGKYLAPADVEKATGLSGVTVTEANNTLTFRTQRIALKVQFQDLKLYKLNKEAPVNVKAMITGVGEEAFSGPAVDTPYMLTFRQKEFCVRLIMFVGGDGKFMLTMDQLIGLGKIIASRI